MPRLGDDIDDYCTRCKRHTNHSIAALAGDEPVKVLCHICNSEHKFNHNEGPKKVLTKEKAFNKLLDQAKTQMAASEKKTPKS